MGGKKKKTMANKLAKMSDEERARYMQQRAEMEEEAIRRKEQLIGTFMKKKVKKEEAYSRLNLAKINQNWHQILRKAKCQEMKNNVQHVKEWIDRLIDYKNRMIAKLLKNLEGAEEDYLNNSNSHSNHLEKILKEQTKYVEKLYAQHLKDVDELKRSSQIERENLYKEAGEEQIYLRTILYRQEINEIASKKEVENYMLNYYEAEHEFQSSLQKMMKSQEQVCTGIWKEVEEQIMEYIEKIDARRMKYAELMRSDAESATEIIDNEGRIKQEQATVHNLKEQLEQLKSAKDLKVSLLEEELNKLKQDFFKKRKDLKKDLETDDRKMKLLVEASTETIEYLQKIAQRGVYIKNLAESCKKFETDREKLVNWFSVTRPNLKTENDVEEVEEEEEQEDEEQESSKVTDDMQELQCILRESLEEDIETEESKSPGIKSDQHSELSPQSIVPEITSPDIANITSVQNITLYDKVPEEVSSPILSPLTSEESEKSEKKTSDFVDGCLKSLEPIENFWTTYNKVEIDCLELKEEKKVLEHENKQLRGMIRAILEAAALANSIPNSKVSTRVPSRKISACSTNVRRINLVK